MMDWGGGGGNNASRFVRNPDILSAVNHEPPVLSVFTCYIPPG